jgi:hypothetical protein
MYLIFTISNFFIVFKLINGFQGGMLAALLPGMQEEVQETFMFIVQFL